MIFASKTDLILCIIHNFSRSKTLSAFFISLQLRLEGFLLVGIWTLLPFWSKDFGSSFPLTRGVSLTADVALLPPLYNNSSSISSWRSRCRAGQDGFFCSEQALTAIFSLSVMKGGEKPSKAPLYLFLGMWWLFTNQADWRNGPNNTSERGNAISKRSSYVAKAADDSWALAKRFDHLFKWH